MSGLGQIQIYWGNGKGKTTAAIGTALRALNHNYKVHVIQFMKHKPSGEIQALAKFPNFSYKIFGTQSWVTDSNLKDKEKAEEALTHLKHTITQEYDMIIADEILYATQIHLLTENQIIELINSHPKNKELLLTGSHVPFPKIFELADLVTEVKKHKHAFDSAVPARKGIEY